MKQTVHTPRNPSKPGLRLRAGQVYRRKDLVGYFSSVDRELGRFVQEGKLCKAAQGLYYVPKKTPFGAAPPAEEALVAKFLEDDRFLVFNPSSYNSLGLGTTQLYNTTVVYNHKRHGKFKLAGMEFDFREKPRFPTAKQVNREFLLVDMLNNLDQLAEDHEKVLQLVQAKLSSFDAVRLQKAVKAYGSVRTRRLMSAWEAAINA
jgi:hypothetical protein